SLVDGAKAQTDFWVNTWLLALGFMVEYAVVVVWLWPSQTLQTLWMPAIALAVALLSSFTAKSSAIEWGDTVKAAFDVFLPDLLTKMGYTLLEDHGDAAKICDRLRQAISYRNRDVLPQRKPEVADGQDHA